MALPEKSIVEDFILRDRLDLSKSYSEEELDWATYDDPYGGGHYVYTFDPSGYLDPGAVYVEFWYSTGGGTWAWGFGIDNVEINNSSRSGRHLESYKLWIDNVLSGEPTEEWCSCSSRS